MAPQSHSSSSVVWAVMKTGRVDYFFADYNYNVYPAIYLK